MPVIFPQTSGISAFGVIAEMRRLKARRFRYEVSRSKFIATWEKLREQLNSSEEYKALRRFVFARSGGECEKCHEVPGDQMCHKIPVAYRPDLALEKSNVYLGCHDCHQLDHPDLKLVR